MKRYIIYSVIACIICIALTAGIAVPLTLHFAGNGAVAPTLPQELAPPECDFSRPWYEQSSIVTHAMGTVEGRLHTNSREAFIENYERGCRVFEADFYLTSDGELVVRHDFTGNSYYNLEQVGNGAMTYEEYKESIICYEYTPLDVKGLFDLMREYPDTYLITDTKIDDVEEGKRSIEKFSEAMDLYGDEDIRRRTIVQLYKYVMYDWAKDIVPEGNFILTLYMFKDKDYDRIGKFCMDKNIPVVTMAGNILTRDVVDKMHSYGLKVYTHTYNRLYDMQKLNTETGVDGFYSDYVTHEEYMNALEIHRKLLVQEFFDFLEEARKGHEDRQVSEGIQDNQEANSSQ